MYLLLLAAAFAALFFIGITVGRFLAGFISDALGDRKMIRLGTGIIVLGIVMISKCYCILKAKRL